MYFSVHFIATTPQIVVKTHTSYLCPFMSHDHIPSRLLSHHTLETTLVKATYKFYIAESSGQISVINPANTFDTDGPTALNHLLLLATSPAPTEVPGTY